jgi:hypothetical protein
MSRLLAVDDVAGRGSRQITRCHPVRTACSIPDHKGLVASSQGVGVAAVDITGTDEHW